MKTYFLRISFFAAGLLLSIATQAQLQVCKIFSNGAMLQQNAVIPIWGKATPEKTITVTMGEYSNSATADASGYWEAEIEATAASKNKHEIVVSDGSETINITDVIFGDVWLAAGQSNMEWTLEYADGGKEEIAAANDNMQREFKIPKGLSAELSDKLPTDAAWNATDGSKTGTFSAVAYYFAKELRKSTNSPIGIVNCSYGGARIEAFMSEEMLGYNSVQVVLQEGLAQERQPNLIYNKMLNPILKFPFKGIIWYQGESNADHLNDAKAYGVQFKKMITSWREEMGQGDLPFIWVQLPNFYEESSEDAPNPGWDFWPRLRANQSSALSLPNTGEATAIDLGTYDIHPTNKVPVGKRLSLVARKLVYGEDIAASGPRYKSHTLDGSTVVIDFDFVENGLSAADDNTVKWFSIAGADGKLVKADAVLDGNKVRVSSSSVTNPTIVRYAWEVNPVGVNLVNSANLPAVPFYININDGSFSVKESFADTTIERGKRCDIDWEVFGASSVSINGEEFNAIDGNSLYPMATTTYTFKAVNAADPTKIYMKEFTITVIDPLPTISLSSNTGVLIEPNTEMIIKADANAPGEGGTVTKVEFFVDGTSELIDETEPYEFAWTPTETKDYVIKATVTDGRAATTTSEPYNVKSTNLDTLLLEGENSVIISGDENTSVANNATASGGKVIHVGDSWRIEFPFYSTKAGKYTLAIRYSLDYATKISQYMYVNGAKMGVNGSVEFEAPAVNTWATKMIDIDVKEGKNVIAFEKEWGWMKFDYLSIAAEPEVLSLKSSIVLSSNMNPIVKPNTEITFTADAVVPNGAITKVEFFVDGVSEFIDDSKPYEFTWTPTEIKDYVITATVTDEKSNETTSEPYSVTSANLDVLTLEAEDSKRTGDVTIKNSSAASGGKFVDVTTDWRIEFSFYSTVADTYTLSIRYLLAYGGPKGQFMFVNDEAQGEISFDQYPDATTWQTKTIDIPVKVGKNVIAFEESWAWQQFDYISLAAAPGVFSKDEQTSIAPELSIEKVISVYPNPVNNELCVVFGKTNSTEQVNVKLVSTNGQTVLNETKSIIDNNLKIQTSNIANGIYMLYIQNAKQVVSKKIIVKH